MRQPTAKKEKEKKSGVASMFEEKKSDERVPSQQDSMAFSNLQRNVIRELNSEGSEIDLPPQGWSNYAKAEERASSMSQRDSFLHPIKGL